MCWTNNKVAAVQLMAISKTNNAEYSMARYAACMASRVGRAIAPEQLEGNCVEQAGVGAALAAAQAAQGGEGRAP